jgi:hypothetical protein
MVGRQLAGRSVVAGAIGMLCLSVGGLGVAAAANGGSLVLGQHNTATSTTTLNNSQGTPLALVGKKSKPPLRVNSSKQVKHLNASLLGGQSPRQLAVSGSAAQTTTNESGLGRPLGSYSAATLVSATGRLPSGTYYVTASALLNATTTSGSFCFVGMDRHGDDALQFGGDAVMGASEATETVVVTLRRSQKVGEYCYGKSSGVTEYNAGILAIRVAHSKHGSAPSVEPAPAAK